MIKQFQLIDVLMQAIATALADVHTATIAKVTRVNAATINCRPVVNRVVKGESVKLPDFLDVPVLALQGGTSYIAMPVAVGDYVLLIFTERCFDKWWIGQDFQSPPELRMHDYSDGIAIVGLRPAAASIVIPTETTIKGVMRLGTENPADYAALASKVDDEINRLWNVLTTWVVAPGDGGAALKAAAITAAAGKLPTASEYVKAD